MILSEPIEIMTHKKTKCIVIHFVYSCLDYIYILFIVYCLYIHIQNVAIFCLDRRKMLLNTLTNVKALDKLPYVDYDYEFVSLIFC